MKADRDRQRLVIDSLSTPTNITNLVITSENDSSVAVGRKELSLELEKKIYSITKGASSPFFNYFKNMASANIQNANILYDFIITEQNHTNVKLSTRLIYIYFS
jgi:hypothetical protein